MGFFHYETLRCLYTVQHISAMRLSWIFHIYAYQVYVWLYGNSIDEQTSQSNLNSRTNIPMFNVNAFYQFTYFAIFTHSQSVSSEMKEAFFVYWCQWWESQHYVVTLFFIVADVFSSHNCKRANQFSRNIANVLVTVLVGAMANWRWGEKPHTYGFGQVVQFTVYNCYLSYTILSAHNHITSHSKRTMS